MYVWHLQCSGLLAVLKDHSWRVLKEPYVVIKTESITCKSSTLSAVLSLWHLALLELAQVLVLTQSRLAKAKFSTTNFKDREAEASSFLK